ncbi:stum [Acrasis kona]|uniref:Stum n=1 Tax=Acrasis kona TaxID=1008807 RepID=A0AAW2Z8Q2_9EUKA
MTLGQTLGNREVPLIPKSHAMLWLVINVFTGGLGNVGAGLEGNHKDTVIIGVIQFLITWVFCWTFVLFFVGWIWALWWSFLIVQASEGNPTAPGPLTQTTKPAPVAADGTAYYTTAPAMSTV